MKRVAIYTRVSTKQQSIENQIVELRTVCERNNWTAVAEYSDFGISGAKGREDRAGLDKMLKSAIRKEFDLVVVWSLDRLGRSVQHLINILGDFQDKNIDIYSHKQGLDTTTKTGKMMFQLLSIFADWEREMISERVLAGQQRAKDRGVKFGRKPISKKRVDDIVALRRKGVGMNKIAKELKVGNSQVLRVCRELAA